MSLNQSMEARAKKAITVLPVREQSRVGNPELRLFFAGN
jgi:hypothetical protein